MPAKSKSPEAAQRKVWTQELSTLDKARRKVTRDHERARTVLEKAVNAAKAKLAAFDKRAAKAFPRATSNIDSRAAVLRGRLGL